MITPIISLQQSNYINNSVRKRVHDQSLIANNPCFKGYIKKITGLGFWCFALESLYKIGFGKSLTGLWDNLPTSPVADNLINVIPLTFAALSSVYIGYKLITSKDYWWINKNKWF